MSNRTFYISSAGNDNAAGTRENPFASLKAARNAARYWRRKDDNAETAEIILLPGIYPVTETLELDREDSNTVIRGEIQGTARLYGGKELKGFELVTDPEVLAILPEEARGKVYQCDLKQNGITDFGKLQELDGCFKQDPHPALECFCNGERLELSRWPKTGFLRPKSLVQAGEFGGLTSILEYDSPRHERWINAEELWLFGYFHWLWADATIKVESIDPEKKLLIMEHAYTTPCGGMDNTQGITYYAFNLLEELSEPGEYYLRRSTGILYFIPPCPIEEVTLEIGMFDQEMICAERTEKLTIRDLDFDTGRLNGLVIRNCKDVLIAGCEISRFAGIGLYVRDSLRCRIVDNDIHSLGRTAIDIRCETNRETLTPEENEIRNNHLHDTGKLVHTYTPPLRIFGCGNIIANNTMYNCPSSAIRIDGNDMIVEYNDIHSVDLESDDQGATDTMGNPTYRGLVFRYNYIHEIGKRYSEKVVCGAAGIRLDDMISGAEIYGNIFERCSNGHFGAVQMNSGRDNRIHDNLFFDCRYAISGGWSPYNRHFINMRNGNSNSAFYFNELYLTRYPELKNVMDWNGTNYVEKNVLCLCGDQHWAAGCKTTFGENLVLRELSLTLEEAQERGRKEIGYKPLDLKKVGAVYHGGCRWKEGSGKVESQPMDWKQEVAPIPICGDAVINNEWKVFGTFTETDPLPTVGELKTIPESLTLNGKTVPAQCVTAENGVLDLSTVLKGSGEKRAVWVFTTLETAGGVSTIGCGFDWWGTLWIDGKEIYSTGDDGNGASPVTAFNHCCNVALTPGRHVVAVRLLTGAMAATLAVSGAAGLRNEWNRTYWWLAQ